MRVVVDTNVLISAAFWYGSSNEIMEKIERKEIDLILSKEIIEEFSRVLGYEEIQEKIKDKSLEMKRTVEKVASVSEIVAPSTRVDIVKDDPDDNKFIEAALEGKAEYIITQDNHLLKLKRYKDIKIVSPEEFLRLLQD